MFLDNKVIVKDGLLFPYMAVNLIYKLYLMNFLFRQNKKKNYLLVSSVDEDIQTNFRIECIFDILHPLYLRRLSSTVSFGYYTNKIKFTVGHTIKVINH